MRRILADNGRLGLSVWNSVGVYNTAVSAALARFVGSDIAARFNASRKTPSADELRQLVTDLVAAPVAVAIASAEPGARSQIGVSVREQLLSYTDGDGITYPEETHVLTAQGRGLNLMPTSEWDARGAGERLSFSGCHKAGTVCYVSAANAKGHSDAILTYFCGLARNAPVLS